MPAIANRWNLPDLGLGLGLRGVHIADILAQRPQFGSDGRPGWFEVITDNALVHQGRFARVLDALAESYPLVLHGVTLNIGSTDPVDRAYVARVKESAARWKSPWVSDHLCWTGVGERQTHDLLPLPYNQATLDWLVARVREVQDQLERPLVLENPSSYLQFRDTTMTEWAFLAELCERADCGLLLDVNNIYVAAQNHDFDWQDYVRAVPWERVCQFHVAGHTTLATHLFDSHIGPVDPPVWDVLRAAFAACGGRSLLLEWDFEIPDFAQTAAEAQRAWDVVADLHVPLPTHPPLAPVVPMPAPPADVTRLRALQTWMLDAIVGQTDDAEAPLWIAEGGRLGPAARVGIHAEMYVARVDDVLQADFPELRQAAGEVQFALWIERFRRAVPSTTFALENVGVHFPAWLRSQPDVAPALAMLARLERARVDASLAPLGAVFDPATLTGLGADDHPRLVLTFAPSVQPLSGTPTVLVWATPAGLHERSLDPVEAALWTQLHAGVPLGHAMAQVAAADPAAEDALGAGVGGWFHAWTAAGLVVNARVAEDA